MGVHFLSDDDVAFLRDLRRKVDGISGEGVVNDAYGVRIVGRRQAQQIPPESIELPFLVLTGNAPTAGCYTMQQVQIASSGVDPTAGGQFTSAQVGSAIGPICYGINIREQDKSAGAASQWDLDASHNPTGFKAIAYAGQAPDGKAKYLFDGRQGDDCTGG